MKPKTGLIIGGGVLALLALSGSSQASVPAPSPQPSPSPTGRARKLDNSRFNPLLKRVVERVREMGGDFDVIKTLRTVQEQMDAVDDGASKFKSDPAQAPHVLGNAVDIWAKPDPNDWGAYLKLARMFAVASEELGAKIRWGGAWNTLSLSDPPEEQAGRYVRWQRSIGQKPLVDPGHFEIEV